MRVFLGITGASGAPYAFRLLRGARGRRLRGRRQRVSGAAIEVLATELYGDARLSRDETLARFTEGTRRRRHRLRAERLAARPTRRGSARVDGYVICPCSMGTLGTVASGAMQNLIHRAASVALKEERKLILVPARDAAVDDPPREHAHAAPRGRDDPVRWRPPSTTAPRPSTTWSTSSSRACSTSSASTSRSSPGGGEP